MVRSNDVLFEDAVIEILSRLPVKSLLRLRCVCKSWCDLVKNPNFISKHLKNVDTRLIVIYMDEDDGTDQFYYPTDLFCLFTDETLEDLSLQDLDLQQPIGGSVSGPYDGIYYIVGLDHRMYLWNLAMGECRRLPKCRATFPHYTRVLCTNVGFGLDPMGNDFKLVLIFTLWNEKRNKSHEFSHCAVYNLLSNSWRDFESFKSIHYSRPHSYSCTYSDGVCYWLWNLHHNQQIIIISFDMGKEVFQEIQGPDIDESAYETLGLYYDSLSLLFLNLIKNCFEIWVMKSTNWSKQLSVGSIPGVNEPLGFWKNGSIFLQSDSQRLLLYDPNTQETRDLGLRSFSFSVYKYKESLIPIKGEDNFFNFFDIPWHVLGVSETDTCPN
ncbi:F-box protein [Melia azedarach]|uniref:F-box protein n=1 Tax=Melia azedarach TaxID=155640 RepID=A0ACC1XS03_MELAZ|nr:F-box protein [Melia azedarach]